MSDPKTFADHGIQVPPTAGNIYRTTCPQCGPTRSTEAHRRAKCLTVWPAEGTWACNHCGWGKGLSLRTREQRAERWQPIERKADAPPRPEMYDWFAKERHIPRTVVDRNRVTQMGGAVAFNYYADGVPVNVKYRANDADGGKKMWQTPDGTHTLYKLDDLTDATTCIITEGEIDALSFEVVGHANAVSLPNGAIGTADTNVAGKLKCLELCADVLDRMETIYLATDADAPGIRTRDELARRLGKKRCMVVRYPEPCKDANETLVRYGRDALARCIREARPYPVEGIIDPIDLTDALLARRRKGVMTSGVAVGIGHLDEYITWKAPQITVVTGVPNHGKSPLTDQITMRLAILHGWRIAYFTPEHETVDHEARLVEQIVGKPYAEDYAGHMSDDECMEAHRFIAEHVRYIEATDATLGFSELMEHCAYLVKRHGTNCIVIDPWGYIESTKAGSTDVHDFTGKCLRQLRRFATNYGVHFLLVAHPKKMSKHKETGETEVPTAYDISGSSHWYNTPDNILSVYRRRDKDTGADAHTEVHVLKVKSKYVGAPGTAFLQFDLACQRFNQLNSANARDNWLFKARALDAPETVAEYHRSGSFDDAEAF